MNTDTNPTNDFPTVTAVKSITSETVHVGKPGRARGSIVTACNGRTMGMGFVFDTTADEVTCKRCRKAITA